MTQVLKYLIKEAGYEHYFLNYYLYFPFSQNQEKKAVFIE